MARNRIVVAGLQRFRCDCCACVHSYIVASFCSQALSLHLIEGIIDQVDGTMQVSWVQPRILTLPQVSGGRVVNNVCKLSCSPVNKVLIRLNAEHVVMHAARRLRACLHA
jgi:hypothetical protein